MANFCLMPEYVDKFKKALKDREIDPAKLLLMASEERHSFLTKFVGKDNAVGVNSLFESKLLLKNQRAGYISWAKNVAGITPQVRRDLISRIEKMDKVLSPQEGQQFLKDLASTRLGADVSQEEATHIFNLSKDIRESKAKITEDMKIGSPERMQYGLATELLKDYVSKLKADAKKISFREDPLKKTRQILWNTIPDLAQTLQTSYDNSIWGRQLVTTLFNPRYAGTWTKSFLKSWKDIGVALKGGDPIIAVKADVYSRPNALNGKYAADPQGYGLGIASEEVYSNTLPARIPVLGRLFKASEAAFNGGALRVRADLADLHIKAAESAGQNVLDKKFAAGLGNFVTSITGRANIQGEGWARTFFYAPRMYLADVHQMTAHLLDPQANKYIRLQAAKNLTLTLGAYGLLFTTAKMVNPDSVDTENKLGKIKIGGQWVDMTGGRASFVTLAAKMGQKIYEYKQGKQPGYGEKTALDDLLSFAENKLSPKASVIKDILTGSMFGGQKVTLENELWSRFTPLTKQDTDKILNDPHTTNGLGLSILSALGLSVSVQNQFKKDWSSSPTKAQSAFQQKVGNTTFKKANDEYNAAYDKWSAQTIDSPEYKKLSDDQKAKVVQTAKDTIQNSIFKHYGFEYKQTRTKPSPQEKQQLDKLKPITQAIIDKLIPSAYASDGGLFGVDTVTTDFNTGQSTKKHDPGIIEQALSAVSSFFNKKTEAQAKTTGEINLKVGVSPNLINEQKTGDAVSIPNISVGKDGTVEYKQIPRDNNYKAGRTGFNPPQPPQFIADIIKKYFGKDASVATLVAATENAQFDPKRADNVNKKDGSKDRGIFQINSNTFNGLMQRQGDKLKSHGITSFDDMYDADKNAYVAKLINDGSKQANPQTNGWGGWFGWQDTGYNINNGWYSAPKRIEYELGKKK